MDAAVLPMPALPAVPGVRDAMAAHRAHLLRFARRRLRDADAAEDVVQDVFEAVLREHAAFAGRSSLRTWLTGVLKHKIVDRLRRQRELCGLDDPGGVAGAEALRLRCPQPLPDEVAEQRQRLRRTLEQIEALPPALREAVQRRLLDGQDTAEVCRALGITETNLFVRLHRARRRLCA
jgi:RNA polymerase sigma-70 factor (ECF subfamily)